MDQSPARTPLPAKLALPTKPVLQNHGQMIDSNTILKGTFVAHIEHHQVLDSTQFRARALAEGSRNSASLPALVVADRQTAGRGRAENRWWTGEGSLAF